MKRFGTIFVCTLLILLSPLSQLHAQDLDSLYRAARQAVFDEDDRDQAQAICATILNLDPKYVDARILLGRCLAWSGAYDSAAVHLEQVLQEQRFYDDARDALLDTYLWNKRWGDVVRVASDGIDLNPRHLNYYLKKGRALEQQGKAREALRTLERIPPENAGDTDVELLRKRLLGKTRIRKITLQYRYDRLTATRTAWQALVLQSDMDPWHRVSLEYQQRMKFGPLLFRLNEATRFGQTGRQFEVESYPSLRKGTYSYLALGYSRAELFPRFRLGAEVFQALPHGFEISAGDRSLFLPDQVIHVLTLSTTKYWRAFLFNLRGFFSNTSGSLSRAWGLQIRRYGQLAENYLQFSLGAGQQPDLGLGTEEISYLGTRQAGIHAHWRYNETILVYGGIQLSNSETRPGRYRGDTGIELGITRIF